MSRKTCRNGFIFVAAICLGLMVMSARGGSLDAPAGPESTNSAMWTLNDIYNKLDTRTTNVTKRAGAFVEPGGGPTNGTMHTLDEIMTLVTNRAPVPRTWQTTSYLTGDDGWNSTNVGVAWPSTRFTVQANTNCVLDNLTGLIWAQNANMFGLTNWGDAVTNCNNLTYGGTNGWRLPNVMEFLSLLDYGRGSPALPSGHPFNCSGSDVLYWTSTTYKPDTAKAWYVYSDRCDEYFDSKTNNNKCTWPVRGGR